ncbi:MAG: PilW family protein [Acidobacteriota bacterium]
MTRQLHLRSDRGFTIMELLISMFIMVGVTGAIFALVDPARGTYRQQPEVSDMQQRLRVGTAFLTNDLMMAGAGSPAGGQLMGALMNYFAPIEPHRIGLTNSDADAGIYYRTDALTIRWVPPNAPQTTVRADMPQPSSELKVQAQSNCAPGTPALCGFKDGMRAVIFDDTGSLDVFTITQVQDAALHLQHRPLHGSSSPNDLSKKYQVGAQIAQIMQRTYYRDNATDQLMLYDGDGRDEPVVDNVVDLRFEYFGDPRPAFLIKPVSDPSGPWTTYGPKPPALGTTPQTGWGWPAGENCIFLVDGGTGTHGPRLADLAPGSEALMLMGAAMLSDGPWCPTTTSPNRYDADLLRIRKIGAVMRVQVASSGLRGPASALFRRGGTAMTSRTMVPDQEIRFEVSPRNFNLGR